MADSGPLRERSSAVEHAPVLIMCVAMVLFAGYFGYFLIAILIAVFLAIAYIVRDERATRRLIDEAKRGGTHPCPDCRYLLSMKDEEVTCPECGRKWSTELLEFHWQPPPPSQSGD